MRYLRITFAAMLALSLVAGGGVSAADNTSSKFDFHIADSFIQAGTGITQTGAVAQAANGDKIRFIGSGTFNTASMNATGSGALVHTDSGGVVKAFGTWTATGVSSATIYPCGGGGLPANFCGGVVVLNVHVTRTSTTTGPAEFDALLTVDCEINPPVAGVEGIKFERPGVLNFDTTVFSPGGLTVFVSRSHQ
jgi:hypothetical protein